jgi:hypothetical protein
MNDKYLQEPPEPEGPGGPGENGGAGSPRVIGGLGGNAGEVLPTGDDRVDDAVAGLSRLPGRPVDEHVAVLEEVHGRLRDILGELNEGNGGNTGPGLADQDESP